VKAMDWLNRRILKRANSVIALDRFMAARLRAKMEQPSHSSKAGSPSHLHTPAKRVSTFPLQQSWITILPPWPMGQHAEAVPHSENWFRTEQGWADKFVVMFSGNHSWVHPLGTILDAAEILADDPRFLFVFIGGGKGKAEVDERIAKWEGEQVGRCESGNVDKPSNLNTFIPSNSRPSVVSLPYQPLEVIRYSLSAADLHLVSLGDNMSGIVHPCKVYGALAIGRPVLALGPKDSYLNDILSEDLVGWSIAHGDVDAAVQALTAAADLSDAERAAMGERARAVVAQKFSREHLIRQFLAALGG
jgi:colanic acid biosynthesis glycosyl transferase WcaI